MMKKFLAAILAIAMIAAMWVVPASASSFTDSLFFNADFTKESTADTVGGVAVVQAGEGITYVDDETIGTKVAHFDSTALAYSIDYTKVQSNFTMEAYVKFPAKYSNFGLIAGTYWANSNSGFGFVMGQFSDSIGSSRAYSVVQGNGSVSSTIAGSKTTTEEWKHLVYTHNGVTESYYEDGVLVASQNVISASIPSDTSQGFRIGGYNLAHNFDLTDMECAYVRLYQSAATGEDVTALYENRNNDAPTPGPVVPTPTQIPSNKLFEVDFSTGAGDDTTGNYVVSQDDFSNNCTIEHDSELDKDVAVFDGWGGITYTTSIQLYNYDLSDGLTLETYVYLDDMQQNMTFIETAGSGLHLQQYNDGSDTQVGLRCGDWLNGAYKMQNAYTEPGTILPAGKWVHLIGTSDGTTDSFYIDGQLAASLDRTQNLLKVPAGNETNNKLTIGESVFGSMWGDTALNGKMAFARIYTNAVDDEGAAELYYEVNPDARPVDPTEEPTALPTEEPTPEPTEEPTPAPLQVTYTSGKTDGKKTDAVPLNETFSIEVYAIPTENGYLVFNARYPFELGDGHISVWEFMHPAYAFTSNAEVKIGEPVHLVLTGSGDTLKLYVNGVYDNSSTSSEMVIGNDNFNFGNIMQLGLVAGDEYVFNVYNREATAEEVAAMYEPYKPAPKREGDIILQSKPSKMFYEVGEELDLTGMVVATKIDGVTTPIAVEDCEITGFDSSTVGEIKISVKYETEDTIFSNSFTLRIIPKQPVGVTAIGLATKPTKLYYEVGEELDTTGLSILAKNADGSTAYISEGLEVTGYDPAVTGNQVLTVSYEGYTTSFTVSTNRVIGIGLETKPGKLSYAYGEALDTTGLTILAKYSDGTIVHSISEGVAVTGYNPKVSGPQVLTVSYEGYTTSFTIKVAEPKLEDTLMYTATVAGQKNTGAINLPESFTIEVSGSGAAGYLIYAARYQIEIDEDGIVKAWEWDHSAPEYQLVSPVAYDTAEDIHVVLVGTGNTLSMYINGEFSASVSDDALLIGNCDFNFGNQVRFGWQSESVVAKIYGMAATAEEVASLYAAR